MYIEIDDSIGEFLSSFTSNQKKIDENILEQIDGLLDLSVIAMKEGVHCVKAKNLKCAKNIVLYAEKVSNTKVENIYRDMARKFSSYLGSLKTYLEFYVSIRISEIPIILEDNIIYVNPQFANTMTFWNKASFLVENINDDKYIKWIVDYEKNKSVFFKDLNYMYFPEQGGGGVSIDTFKRCCEENKFIFALLDSDKKTPTDEIKDESTAGRFINFTNMPPNGRYYIMQVHEIENLFSSDRFLNLAVASNSRKAFSELKSVAPDVRQYFDIKLGYNYKNYMNNEYIKGIFKKNTHPCKEVCDMNNCKKRCGVCVIQGFGTNYLSILFSYESQFSDAPEGLIPEIKNEWNVITKKIMTWFCAYKFKGLGSG